MSTITKSAFGSPGRSDISAAALVTLASEMALARDGAGACCPSAVSNAAQSTERHGTTIPVIGRKTLLELDSDTAGALSDAGVEVEATGAIV